MKASRWSSLLNKEQTSQSSFVSQFLWELYGTNITKKALNPKMVPGSVAFTPKKYELFCSKFSIFFYLDCMFSLEVIICTMIFVFSFVEAHDAYITKNKFLGKPVETTEERRNRSKSIYRKACAQKNEYVSQAIKRSKSLDKKKKNSEDDA